MGKVKKLKVEKLFSYLAFIVSVATLCIFFYQTSLMKKQQYASVLPFLSMGNTEVNKNYSFILVNNGIGPAFIDEINIHYKDTIYRNMDVNGFFEEVISKKDTLFSSVGITHSTLRKGMLIPEKEMKHMLQLKRDINNFKEKRKRLRYWLNNEIKIAIKYSSVYGEQWSIIYPEEETPIKIK